MKYLNFMNKNFKISFMIRIIVTWYILMISLRIFVLDHSWNPTILILPIWFFIMIVGGYNEFQFKNYIQDRYFNGEYIISKYNFFLKKSTFYIPNFLTPKDNKDEILPMTISWNQNSHKDDKVIKYYMLNNKLFLKIIIYFIISIPFVLFLTTMNWSL